MKLELKHLAPYLPYGLKAINTHRGLIVDVLGLQKDLDVIHNHGKTPLKFIQPILRPLSDLTQEIEIYGKKQNFADCFLSVSVKEIDLFYEKGITPEYWKIVMDMVKKGDFKYLDYWIVEKLLEWHFDVFRLISKNLAIDINTLNK